jgi:hypothetical protein
MAPPCYVLRNVFPGRRYAGLLENAAWLQP